MVKQVRCLVTTHQDLRFMINKNHIGKLPLGMFVLLFAACMKTITLQNGITKVPVKADVYKNKTKFDKSLLTLIDTKAIYEELDQRYNVLRRLDTHVETSLYGAYRFYPDGRFNSFGVDRNAPLDANTFNPEYSGYRGVYYLEKGQIRYDLFGPVNQLYWTGELNGTFKFSGDTLYVIRDVDKRYIGIYIKREFPQSYLDYKAEW